jgi:cytochrome bd-type quinol oxidase subunit 2
MPSYGTTSEGPGSRLLLFIVPVAALLIVIGAIAAITSHSRRRWLSSTWEVLLSLVGGLTSVVALWQIESARRDPNSLGLGMLMIKVEPAFYLTIVAFAVALIGAVLDVKDTS